MVTSVCPLSAALKASQVEGEPEEEGEGAEEGKACGSIPELLGQLSYCLQPLVSLASVKHLIIEIATLAVSCISTRILYINTRILYIKTRILYFNTRMDSVQQF